MILPTGLENRDQVVIDSNIFIYLFEDHEEFGGTAEFIIEQAEKCIFSACITPITMAEVIVKPLQNGRYDLADKFRAICREWNNIHEISLGPETGLMAGALRARYGFPLPDMMQVAAAMQSDQPALITNDHSLNRIEEIDVYLLNEFC